MEAPAPAPTPDEKPKREPKPKPKAKNDPRQVAAARELRDRWLEEANAGRYLPVVTPRYGVSRALGGGTAHAAQLSAISLPALHAPQAA